MLGITNTQGIKKIIMKPRATCFCKIGQDYYTNEFEIEFTPDNTYPDYMEVDRWISEMLDGKRLNIEEAVELLYGYLLRYNPTSLMVRSIVKDCKTHFDVIVEK